MATIPTQNAVPSEAPRDLKFNSGKIDEFVTSLEHEYKDRFGRCHMTIEGMRWIFDQLMERFQLDINQAIIAAGYIPMDSFQQGAEITKRNEILRDETTGEYYRWDGDLPKSVPAGSTPESAGGVGVGTWVSVGDASLRGELSTLHGAGMIGFGDSTVKDKLTYSVDKLTNLQGELIPTPPASLYKGNLHYNPVSDNGAFASNIVVQTPTDIDFSFSSDIQPPQDGVFISLGKKGLSSGDMISQDLYTVRNLTYVSGTPEVIASEPWTALMLTIDGNKIINSGEISKYAINLKQQNWWPLVTNNIFTDVTDSKANFLKAIDDGGDEDLRFSGNSRVVASNNRMKWHGILVGGVGFYVSATGSMFGRNAFEGPKIAYHLGYPSSSVKIRDDYCELPFNGACYIAIGDGESTTGHTDIINVLVDGVYVNLHGFNDTWFIDTYPNTVINKLTIDNIVVSGALINRPIMRIQDKGGQSIYAGTIDCGGAPLIGLTPTYHVKVIDKNNLNIPQLNSDLIGVDPRPATTLPANSSVQIGEGLNVFVRSSVITEWLVDEISHLTRPLLRNARHSVVVRNGGDTQKTIMWYIDGRDLHGIFTLQFFAYTATVVDITVQVLSATTPIATKTFKSTGDWQEYSFDLFNPDSSLLVNDGMLRVEISSLTGELGATGLRTYKGSCGLCLSPNSGNKNETIRLCSQIEYPVP